MSLLSAFSAAVLRTHTSARIDNIVFHSHYRLTSLMLTAAAILVSSSEYFGKPITCGPAPPALSEGLLENYCWTRSTFSLINPKQAVPYPGISTVQNGDQTFYHTYYQWVWLVLSLQAAMFYLPRYIWKKIEGGQMKCLIAGLTEPLCEDAGREGRISLLAQYIARCWNKRKRWAFSYFFCELLNFVNVVAQIFIINSFLGGTFTTYGSRVLNYGFLDQEDRNDTMAVIFPRLTKCTFRAFGPSGNFQVHDAICVLPLNIINEKIYVFLWFWLVILAVPSGLIVLYRLFIICFPRFGVKILYWRYSIQRQYVSTLFGCANVGDLFLLNLVGRNVDSYAFDKLVEQLEAEKISTYKTIKKFDSMNGTSC